MLFTLVNSAKTDNVRLPSRPASNPTFTVYGIGGGVISTGTGTLNSVNTTLSASASIGATSVTVTSATGINAGEWFQIGGSEENGGETVEVDSVSGTTVNLVSPLTKARASSTTFASTLCSISIPALGTVGRGYRVEFSSPAFTIGFSCCRYAPITSLTIAHLRTFDPTFTKRLPQGTSLKSLISLSWEDLIRSISQEVEPGSMQGFVDLTNTHAWYVRWLVATASSNTDGAYRDYLAKVCAEEKEKALSAAKFDGDTPGVAEDNAQFRKTIRVSRA